MSSPSNKYKVFAVLLHCVKPATVDTFKVKYLAVLVKLNRVAMFTHLCDHLISKLVNGYMWCLNKYQNRGKKRKKGNCGIH